MTIRPLGTETQPGFGEAIQLLKVELAMRMNPGTTASLWLQPAPESNEVEESNAPILSLAISPELQTPQFNASQEVIRPRSFSRLGKTAAMI